MNFHDIVAFDDVVAFAAEAVVLLMVILALETLFQNPE